MATTRLKGVALKLDLGTPATDYWADVISVEQTHGDPDTVTFADVMGGATSGAKLKIKAVTSTDTASFWRYVWDHAGELVAITWAPHGNTAPTPAEPHFVGMVRVGNRPDLSVEAGRTKTSTFEVEWEIDGVITLDDGA